MYVASKNMKSELNYELQAVRCHNVTGNVSEYFFCEKCRTLSPSNGTQTRKCPHCGTVYTSNDIKDVYPSTDNKQHEKRFSFEFLDSVTVNYTKRDDGSVKDVNGTLLYRVYKYDEFMQNQRSYAYYNRITFNLETNQVYYTINYTGHKDVDFTHFSIVTSYYDVWGDFARVNLVIMEFLFGYYDEHYVSSVPLVLPEWAKSNPSDVVAFFCLKFPVAVTHMTTVDFMDSLLRTIYYACNWDKTLRNALTARSTSEYDVQVRAIYTSYDDYDMYEDKPLLFHPLAVIYARYMYQLGFRKLTSVLSIVTAWFRCVNDNDIFSVWLLDILRKRDHTRKKFFRRLLKQQGEFAVVSSFLSSDLVSYYRDYYFGDSEADMMKEFWKKLKDDDVLMNIDYNVICDSIVRSVVR